VLHRSSSCMHAVAITPVESQRRLVWNGCHRVWARISKRNGRQRRCCRAPRSSLVDHCIQRRRRTDGGKHSEPGRRHKRADPHAWPLQIHFRSFAIGHCHSTWQRSLIFQIASGLTVGTGASVVLSGGATAANVFWQVGSSATLGTTADFKGTILALTSISLATGAKLEGRVLAQHGAVTLDTNDVTIPLAQGVLVYVPPVAPPPRD
jgi:hypothetical protein